MNKSQFKAQFDNLYLPLCMYSLKIVGIREEAEDIVQGCFTSVWERICNGDDIENIRAYMYGAVRNMSLTFLKRSSKIDELESGSNMEKACRLMTLTLLNEMPDFGKQSATCRKSAEKFSC